MSLKSGFILLLLYANWKFRYKFNSNFVLLSQLDHSFIKKITWMDHYYFTLVAQNNFWTTSVYSTLQNIIFLPALKHNSIWLESTWRKRQVFCQQRILRVRVSSCHNTIPFKRLLHFDMCECEAKDVAITWSFFWKHKIPSLTVGNRKNLNAYSLKQKILRFFFFAV